MKKHLVKFTLILLAIALGVSNAFAEDVYKKDGEDKTCGWTTDDENEWEGTKLADDGKSLNIVGTGSTSKEFNFNSQEPLVTLVAKFKAGNNCGNEGSYDFFTFGGITFKFNRVKNDDSGYFKLVVDGKEKTLEGKPKTSGYYKITIVVNHAKDEAYYTLDNSDDDDVLIASGTVSTKADFKKVEFGHHTAEGATFSKNVCLRSLEIKEDPDVVLTLKNTYLYSTFCSDWDVDFSGVTEVAAYKANVNGNVVTLTQVKDKVKAGEGLLIKNVGNVTSVKLPIVHDAEALANNCLKGVTKNMVASDFAGSDFAGKKAYILANDKEFKYIDPEKSRGTLQKGKAYLLLSDETLAKPSTLFIGEATAINGVAVEKKADNAIYNLQGMRVKTPTKGLYIINGKKYRF